MSAINGANTKGRFGRGGYAGNDTGAGYGGTRISPAGPLGTFAFSATLFIFSLYIATARGINTSNLVIGMALFVGGLVTLLAGMWEFPLFTLYGAFWLSYAVIFIPASGILAAYGASSSGNGAGTEFVNALGIYWMTWFAITFLIFIASFRTHLGSVASLHSCGCSISSWVSTSFTGNRGVLHAAAAWGIITSIIGWYVALTELLSAEHGSNGFGLPLGHMGGLGSPYSRNNAGLAPGTAAGTAPATV
ncbi:hypothetical protein BT96DRAFT_991266 [Gymnopus androsaceus JB14]|uniref:FUN34 transmembrane protein n=1 Tax=Gymnopus androsaceus JB14 TaxID=1447944 RepID=A0A6A4HV01_9AGAR|nr:hypothetical protein BT96DRAFT_991266 [Gymnopus androsaceus JB14]